MALIIFIFGMLFVLFIAWQYNKSTESPSNSELQYFGIKDKGYHVSVWPKDKGVGECLEFPIAGVTYRQNIDSYLGEFVGRLVAEPLNPYDPNAIKILAANGHHVGYVPKDMTSAVRFAAKLPCKCYCYIGKHIDGDGTHYYTDCYIDT